MRCSDGMRLHTGCGIAGASEVRGQEVTRLRAGASAWQAPLLALLALCVSLAGGVALAQRRGGFGGGRNMVQDSRVRAERPL